MIKKDQNQIFEELYHLQNCELALGEYFNELARLYPDEKWFWEQAVGEEVNHARQVGRLIAQVSSNLNKFAFGRYRVELLKTFLDGIYANVQKIRSKQLSRPEILQIALDYETSFIESKPYDIVSSADSDFLLFKTTFSEELLEHTSKMKAYIQQKLATAVAANQP